MSEIFRIYQHAGRDGYPPEWHRIPNLLLYTGPTEQTGRPGGIKDLVRVQAGERCVRCGHPYMKGTVPMATDPETGKKVSWSPCDTHCTHGGPIRWDDATVAEHEREWKVQASLGGQRAGDGILDFGPSGEMIERYAVEAAWRILTVHHLNGVKLDCRWWNLAALCQRCHLTIQGKVRLDRRFIREHSDWFKPYAAGWYAFRYLHEDLTREETMARLDELLAQELFQEALW